MKILMIAPDCYMIDRRILAQARSLQNNGYEVELISGFECERTQNYTEQQIPIHRYRLDTFKKKYESWFFYNKMLGKIGRSALRFLYLRWVGFFDLITDYENEIISIILKNYKFDVIHAHDFPMLRIALELKKITNCKVVYDSHEIYHDQLSLPLRIRKKYRKRERKIVSNVDLFTTVNDFLAQHFKKDYKLKFLPHVILNAQELRAVSPDGREQAIKKFNLDIQPGQKVLIYQGWISSDRNIDIVIDVIKLLDKDFKMIVVGYGDHLDFLKFKARQMGCQDKVLFLGKVENYLLFEITQICDMGIIPYIPVDLNTMYCSPNKLFEFINAEIPFVCNLSPYLMKFIDEHKCGLAVDMKNPEEIAEAIKKCVNDSTQVYKNNAIRAKEQLNWNVEAKKLIELYKKDVG